MSMSESEVAALIERAIDKKLSGLAAARAKEPAESQVSHVLHCPECFDATVKKLFSESEYECADCGLPLGDKSFVEKLPKCPKCGGTDPRKR